MNQEYTTAAEQKMKASLEHFKEELSGLRSGRAHAGLVDSIKVNVYGSEMILKSIATVSTPDAKTIQIQPWDNTNLAAIEKAISENQALGLTPNNDGHVIRLNIPPMSEESRSQMVKLLSQKAEEGNISLRNARHEALNDAKNDQKASKITQDDLSRLEKDLNVLIDKYSAQIQELVKTKEQELMQV